MVSGFLRWLLSHPQYIFTCHSIQKTNFVVRSHTSLIHERLTSQLDGTVPSVLRSLLPERRMVLADEDHGQASNVHMVRRFNGRQPCGDDVATMVHEVVEMKPDIEPCAVEVWQHLFPNNLACSCQRQDCVPSKASEMDSLIVTLWVIVDCQFRDLTP